MLSNISSNNMPEVDSISLNQANKSGNVVLLRKNDTGYIKSMDYDNDGAITLDEFNQYCEENSIDGDGRLKLLTTILLSKTAAEIKEDIKKNNPQEFSEEENKENLSIHDENNENKEVSFQEYLDYYEEKYNQTNNATQEEKTENTKDVKLKKAISAYNQKEEQKPDLKIDGKI